jgi:hypothetical protein
MERDAYRVLESYRSLDVLGTAVFQVGVAAAALGATIGLAIKFNHHYLVAVWGIFPLCAGCYAGLEVMETSGVSPTRASLEKKRRHINAAAVSLVLSLFLAATALILAVTILERPDYRVMMPHTKRQVIIESRQADTQIQVKIVWSEAPRN